MNKINPVSTIITIKKEFKFSDIVGFIQGSDDIWLHNGYYSHYNHTMNLIGINQTNKEKSFFTLHMDHFGINMGTDIIATIFDYNTETLTIKYKLHGGM